MNTLPLANFDIVNSRLVSNGLIFSGSIPDDSQIVTKNFDNHRHL